MKIKRTTALSIRHLLDPTSWMRAHLLFACAPEEAPAAHDLTAFPGERYFRNGACNTFVTCVRSMLVERGALGYYLTGPALGVGWSEQDSRACSAFQRAQKWRVTASQGRMDSRTWAHLVNGQGVDIPPEAATDYLLRYPSGDDNSPTPPPDYPGREAFGTGKSNVSILLLRLKLALSGFADDQIDMLHDASMLHHSWTWDERLRSACTTFQLRQGWRGRQATGFPCADTWRLLWKP
ncbi:peptidoglycan-binding protein [Streptomyces pathocidini]|uniref:Peptidoglycan-binding protein n=1 Tax=Streptomyces pathocidini TaxID=1650571 RepID=A0ABW7UXE1_9ACTN|nr:peptidoglycan-binding protein [Streptomyces pathocidini]